MRRPCWGADHPLKSMSILAGAAKYTIADFITDDGYACIYWYDGYLEGCHSVHVWEQSFTQARGYIVRVSLWELETCIASSVITYGAEGFDAKVTV